MLYIYIEYGFRERFPYYNIEKSDRGTIVFIHDDKNKFTPEELLAQLFAKARDYAEINHGEFFKLFLKLLGLKLLVDK